LLRTGETEISDRASGADREAADQFLANVDKQLAELRTGESAAPESSPSATARASDRSSGAQSWVGFCVWSFGVAAALSVLGGVGIFIDQVGADGTFAVTALLVGIISAAVWVGAAVILLLLSEATENLRLLAQRMS
jgi:hypothetical protein